MSNKKQCRASPKFSAMLTVWFSDSLLCVWAHCFVFGLTFWFCKLMIWFSVRFRAHCLALRSRNGFVSSRNCFVLTKMFCDHGALWLTIWFFGSLFGFWAHHFVLRLTIWFCKNLNRSQKNHSQNSFVSNFANLNRSSTSNNRSSENPGCVLKRRGSWSAALVVGSSEK